MKKKTVRSWDFLRHTLLLAAGSARMPAWSALFAQIWPASLS
jgi:hypothetical protein